MTACTRLVFAILAAGASLAASAQDADALAKQLSNPVANLTSVPLQFNYDEGYDSAGNGEEGNHFLLNVQPVIPVSINEKWNLISRTILPIINQNDVAPGGGSQFGLGDTTQSFFFSPKALTKGGWTWGVGPALLIPTATNDALGSDQWGAGPTIVALRQTQAGWTYGFLMNHIWSFTGDDDQQDINQTYLQPFLSKALGKGRTVTVNFESTYNWKGDQWSVPFNLGYSKVSKVGHQMVSWYGGVRYWVETPEGGPDWGLRFTLTLLYPHKK
jgi:hypothetical protein